MEFIRPRLRAFALRRNFLWLLSAPTTAARWAVALSFVPFAGCYWPSPPPADVMAPIEVTETHEVFQSQRVSRRIPRRNLVFLAVDEVVEAKLRESLTAPPPAGLTEWPSLEDLAWWEMAPLFAARYQKVIRFKPAGARFHELERQLHRAQSWNEPFDVVILSHGFPNHLSSGSRGYFLSYREMAGWQGRFPGLDLVFLQACFGSSLARDWLNAGARHVIGFDGFNINFYFVNLYFQYLRHFSVEDSYQSTRASLGWYIQNTLATAWFFAAMNVPVQDYISSLEHPSLNSR